jgi:hypothetical protein
MAFAPLDVWARLIARHGASPRYWLRIAFGLFTSCIGTVLTLPERLMLAPVLRARAARNGARLEHAPGVVVILGYFRSGTTHLHYLMSCDPRFRSPRWCEVLAPQGFLLSWAFLRVFMIPFVSAKRPQDDVAIGPEWPAEDDFAAANWGLASSLLGKFVVPRAHGRYDRYHDLDGLTARERRAWRFVQWAFCWKLARVAGRRAILLKTPSHTARVRELVDLFGPGVRFVHISREPSAVVKSNVAMAERLEIYNLQSRPAGDDVRGRVMREYIGTERKYLAEAAGLAPGMLTSLRYEDLIADPIGSLRRVYAELGLAWTEEFEGRALDYLHSVRDYRAATKPKAAGAAEASEPALDELARTFGNDRPAVATCELPERAAAAGGTPAPPTARGSAPARSMRGVGAAVGIAVVCFFAWLVQAWFLHDRHDWLAWPAGVVIGLSAIRAAKVGSVRLGLLAAGLTVLVFALASVPATFLSDYAHRTAPPFYVGYRPLPPVREWEWYHILKASRAGSLATNNLFWLFMGAVTAYRFASRKHVHPPGTR